MSQTGVTPDSRNVPDVSAAGRGFQIADDRYSVKRVAEDAAAYLAARETALALSPLPMRLPSKPLSEGGVYVYVIGAGAISKIGIARNLRMRFSNVCVDNPHATGVEFYAELPRMVGKHVELLLHAVLAPVCVGGEWFAMEPPRAKAALESLIAAIDQIGPRPLVLR